MVNVKCDWCNWSLLITLHCLQTLNKLHLLLMLLLIFCICPTDGATALLCCRLLNQFPREITSEWSYYKVNCFVWYIIYLKCQQPSHFNGKFLQSFDKMYFWFCCRFLLWNTILYESVIFVLFCLSLKWFLWIFFSGLCIILLQSYLFQFKNEFSLHVKN